ncbi:MAG: hypothetical protein E4G99_00060 [Anaerolineales bacterium]|nr:MAG: hypothetical protein E4G99_00060 [Anaerolineales bacterium]
MISPIALLTDFGQEDIYVAAMKAVILARLPSISIIDLTHNIAPGDILHGAFEIWRIRPYLPQGTTLVGVVDPGVGTQRKPIAINFPGLCCVGPDNGLFSFLLETEPEHIAVELNRSEFWGAQVSSTFHGRDIFAPVAAQLAGGISLDEVGDEFSSPFRLPRSRLEVTPYKAITGEILHIDHFGNLISSIGCLNYTGGGLQFSSWLGDQEPFEFKQEQVRIQLSDAKPLMLMESFGAAASGQPLAYIGSAGLLEVAVNGGHAAQIFNASRGDPITLTF